jgi:hypothetical protein
MESQGGDRGALVSTPLAGHRPNRDSVVRHDAKPADKAFRAADHEGAQDLRSKAPSSHSASYDVSGGDSHGVLVEGNPESTGLGSIPLIALGIRRLLLILQHSFRCLVLMAQPSLQRLVLALQGSLRQKFPPPLQDTCLMMIG